MGSDASKQVFRQRCSYLQSFPLYKIDVMAAGPLLDQLGTTPFYAIASNLEVYERQLSQSVGQEDMRVRALLGDPEAADYLNNLPEKFINVSHQTISTILWQYRVLDLEARRTSLEVGVVAPPVPQTIRAHDFSNYRTRRLLSKLENWRKYIVIFNTLVLAVQSPDVDKDITISARKSIVHLHNLGKAFCNGQLEVIVSNFRAAAFHLAVSQEIAPIVPAVLPDLPETHEAIAAVLLAPNEIDKYEAFAQLKIRAFLTSKAIDEIRLPLHLATLISPLLLIMPVELGKSEVTRRTINSLSVAIGNQQPEQLSRLELEIWTTLVKICDDSSAEGVLIAFNDLISSSIFQQVINLPTSDAIFHFFRATANTDGQLQLTRTPHTAKGCQAKTVDHQYNPVDTEMSNDTPANPEQVAGTDTSSRAVDDERSADANNRDFTVQAVDGNATRPLTSASRDISQIRQEVQAHRHPHLENSACDQDDSFMHAISSKSVPTPWSSGTVGSAQTPIVRHRRPECSSDSELLEDGNSVTKLQSITEAVKDSLNAAFRANEANDESELSDEELEVVQIAARRSTRISRKSGQSTEPVAAAKTPRRRDSFRMVVDKSMDEEDTEHTSNDGDSMVESLSWSKVEEQFVDQKPPPNEDAAKKPAPVHYADRTYKAWRPHGGHVDFRPAAHYKKPLRDLTNMLDFVEEGYVNGKPRHLCDENMSMFKIYSAEEFINLPDSVVQDVFQRQHLVLTGQPHSQITFEKALKRLAPLHRITDIQDQSIPPTKDRTRSGFVKELLDATQPDHLKILNGLLFPMPMAGIETTAYSSDSHALLNVMFQEGFPIRDLSIGHVRWGLAGVDSTWHLWHIDSDGFATFIDVITGAKLWIVGSPIDGSESGLEVFNNAELFFKKQFNLNKTGKGLFSVEAILLEPGTRLVMRPNTLHSVYTIEKAICHGGHFYATSTLRDTLAGLVHAFICHRYITNITHPPFRFLIAQLINFYHSGLVDKRIDSGEPSHDHLPDPTNPKGLTDLMVACVLGALLNVLSFETYNADPESQEAPMTEEEESAWLHDDINKMSESDRKMCCLARGQAFQIVNWLQVQFKVKNNSKATPRFIFSHLLVGTCTRILHYKFRADCQDIAHHTNFTMERIRHQIAGLLAVPNIDCDIDTRQWKFPMYKDPCSIIADTKLDYELSPIANAHFIPLSIKGLFKAGETPLDKKFACRMDVKAESVDDIGSDNEGGPPLKRKRAA